ncbi:MAG: hypothetical protein HZA81_00400 [Candidatus Taylorbacteria bacterium]|nr:hypothetical protein [Candidatus Taylorbacteria bacterium]
MSLFSPKSELGVVFHIGSSSVGAGLVRLKRGEIPHVVFALREPLPYRDELDAQRFLADMVEAVKRTNLRLAKEGLAHLKFTEFGSLSVKRVFCAFASPWSVTQTKIATIEKKEGFVFTKEMAERVLREQEKIFEREMAEGSPGLANALDTIEERVVQIKLNGYEIAEPYGKRAEKAEISIFMSFVPKAVVEKVSEAAYMAYHPKSVQSFSLPLAAFSTVRSAFKGEKDFIFLDIGGELSEISVVKDGLMLETASFPFGRHFVVRKVSKALGASPEEAASLIRLAEENQATPDVLERLAPIMAEARKEWMDAFHYVLQGVSTRTSVPTKLFAVIYNDFVPFFMKALKDEKVAEFGVIDVPLSVTLLNHDKLKPVVAFGKHSDKDPFLALLSAFAGKLYSSE